MADTIEVVINDGVGGFALSKRAYQLLGLVWDGYGYGWEFVSDRANPRLIAAVRRLGVGANGAMATLRIVEVPSDANWHIADDEAGCEWVAEDHRTWPTD